MSNQAVGSFTFILHAHLPYVLAHGRWPHGTDTLFECAAETYLPLLNIFNRLVSEGCSPKVTLGITPVLTEQLADEEFRREFPEYLEIRIRGADENRREFEQEGEPHLAELAKMWHQHFMGIRDEFVHRYGRDLVGGFRALQDGGHIEIITSAATHGYLPLIGEDTSVQAQVKQGIAAYQRHFGRPPHGFWLPECAYRPRYRWAPPVTNGISAQPRLRKGVEEFLSENQIDYFVIDSHMLMGGEAIGVYLDRFEALRTLWRQFEAAYRPQPIDTDKSTFRPYLVSSSPEGMRPVAVFSRNPETSIQVWSGEHGYPGDGWYLDFHKKHFPGGHRYWRVTSAKSDLAEKKTYEPHRAAERVPENAGHFKQLVKDLLWRHNQEGGGHGILCAAYDTELFGHWWYEGVEWLYHVIKWVHDDPDLRLATCSEFLADHGPSTVISLPEASWGQGGFHWIWLNEWTTWTWKHIYRAEAEMHALAVEFGERDDSQLQDILRQCARELLLLESSDWQFLISTWSARDYAEARAAYHAQAFQRLAAMARKCGRGEAVDHVDWTFLGDCQRRDAIFPDVEPKWWARVDYPPQE